MNARQMNLYYWIVTQKPMTPFQLYNNRPAACMLDFTNEDHDKIVLLNDLVVLTDNNLIFNSNGYIDINKPTIARS